jgi:RimJ/RimL family protein N-acetyltransferase
LKVTRYSGIRLDSKSHLYLPQFETIAKKAIEIGAEIVEKSRVEPFFWFDHDKPKSTDLLIKEMLWGGELFFVEHEDKIVAFACFRNVIAGRFANLELYIVPEYRKHILLGQFRDILYKAAFAPYPEGLQLVKLKAFPHVDNKISIRTLKKSEFIQLCELRFEGLLNGHLCSMLALELFPREITSMQGAVITNARTISPTKSDTVFRRAGKLKHSPKLRKQPAELPKHKPESFIQP